MRKVEDGPSNVAKKTWTCVHASPQPYSLSKPRVKSICITKWVDRSTLWTVKKAVCRKLCSAPLADTGETTTLSGRGDSRGLRRPLERREPASGRQRVVAMSPQMTAMIVPLSTECLTRTGASERAAKDVRERLLRRHRQSYI